MMTEHPVNPILDSYYSRIVCMFAINIPLPRLRTWPGCSDARPGTPSAYDLQCLLCRIQLFELGSRNRRLARAAKVEVQP